MEPIDRLFDAARAAQSRAYAPYSRFPVGAAILTESGAVFAGCNVEIAAYPNGLCAESAAIAAMVVAGERRITDVLVIGGHAGPITPCGACRQRLVEFATSTTRVYTANSSGPIDHCYLHDLLPRAFSPNDLAESQRTMKHDE